MLSAEDAARFRATLGRYPTGVTVVTAIEATGDVAAMVVGSFMSVSLDPPLVGFLPMRSSASWGRIAPVGQFCVNVLSEDQAPLCRALASRDRDALLSARFELSPLGSPILSGVVAWIDCTIHSVQDAGDHYMVLGRVHNLGSGEGGSALIFCNGSYGVFGDSAAGNVSIANR